jgi:hypothetical protein
MRAFQRADGYPRARAVTAQRMRSHSAATRIRATAPMGVMSLHLLSLPTVHSGLEATLEPAVTESYQLREATPRLARRARKSPA